MGRHGAAVVLLRSGVWFRLLVEAVAAADPPARVPTRDAPALLVLVLGTPGLGMSDHGTRAAPRVRALFIPWRQGVHHIGLVDAALAEVDENECDAADDEETGTDSNANDSSGRDGGGGCSRLLFGYVLGSIGDFQDTPGERSARQPKELSGFGLLLTARLEGDEDCGVRLVNAPQLCRMEKRSPQFER